MGEVEEKTKRVKYIRGLERFAKSAIGILKRSDFDRFEFEQRVDKNSKILEKIEPTYLDNPYTKALENFVNLTLEKREKDELLKLANALDKLRNCKSYKKDKHKNKFKEDI